MTVPLAMAAFKVAAANAPLIGAALSVGTAVQSHVAQDAMTDAQNAEIASANERQRQYMIDDLDQTTRQAQQAVAQATQETNQNEVEGLKARRSAEAAASAGGVSGFSVDALLGDLYGKEAQFRDGVNQNLENTGQQLDVERKSIGRQYTETVRSRPLRSGPSLLGTSLKAGSGVYSAYKDRLKVVSQL